MHNMNRSSRRKAIQSAKRKQKLHKAGAITLATLVASSTVVSAHAATTGEYKADVVLNDYLGSNMEQTTAWEIEDNKKNPLELTASERENIIRLASGKMEGSVKLSMSAEDKKKLADAGINFDIEASEKQTNQRIKDLNNLKDQDSTYAGVTQPELLVKYSVDESKATAKATELGISDINDEEAFHFGTMLGSGRAVLDNIMTDAVRGDLNEFAQGDQLANIGTVNEAERDAYDRTGEPIEGYKVVSSLYPVSQVANGGVLEDGEVDSATTMLTDPYSDGDSTLRQTQINSVSKRGFTGDISNCMTDDCGLYFALEVQSENGNFLLTDPVRLNVESTVTAGKTPTSMTLKSGDKVTFIPQKSEVLGYHADNLTPEHFEYNYFTASKVGEWQFASQFAENIKMLKDSLEKVGTSEVSVLPNGDTGVRLVVESTSGSVASKAEKVSASSIRVTLSNSKDTKFVVKGKELLAENVGKKTRLTDDHRMILESVSEKETTFVIENLAGNMATKDVKVDAITLGVELNLVLPSASTSQSGGFSLTYTKAEKPEEPTPNPSPTPEPELPKPEAIKDSKTGKQGQPVKVSVMDNDTISEGFTYKAKSLRLIAPDTKQEVMSFAFEGKGEYKVVGENVVFTPIQTFAGKAPAIGYSWVESNGEVEQGASSTVQVTITAETKPVVPTPTPEVDTPDPTPTPSPEKEVEIPEPDPIETPESDEQEPEPTPTPTPEKEVEITDPPVDEGDSDKDDEPIIDESINNSGASTGTLTLLGVSLAGFLAGVITLFSRKDKKAKDKHSN